MTDISVHLTRFPVADLDLKDEALGASMALVSRIVQIGLAWRSRNKIRVRQPLATMSVSEHLDADFVDIIKDELNVKDLVIDTTLRDKVTEIIKPDGKKLGKKLGSDFKKVLMAAKSGDFVDNGDGTVTVSDIVLSADEYERSYIKTDETLDVEVQDGIVVWIDAEITPALTQEWYVRDMVRHIQESRKEAWYDIADRIQLGLSGDFDYSGRESYIQEETLSTLTDVTQWDYTKTVTLGDTDVIMVLQRG